MAITITAEQYYKDGVAQTTPVVSGSNKFVYVGAQSANSTWYKYALKLTCTTTRPLTSVTLSVTHMGTDNTDNLAYFGMYVTAEQTDSYLTSTGGETKLRFSKKCVDNGSWEASGNNKTAIGTVTKAIPSGTFYIYIVPYNTNYHSYSTVRSLQMADGAPTATGEEVDIGLLYIANGSKFEAYEVWIADGSKFVQYEPYVADGSKFVLCE